MYTLHTFHKTFGKYVHTVTPIIFKFFLFGLHKRVYIRFATRKPLFVLGSEQYSDDET